jgi:hypothetical protein
MYVFDDKTANLQIFIHVIRPLDVHIGKLIMKTATDYWVTRGHLKYVSSLVEYIPWWLNVQSSQCKPMGEHCFETKRCMKSAKPESYRYRL